MISTKDINPRVYIVCGGRRTGTTLLTAILSSDIRANPLGQEAQILTRLVEAFKWGSENFNSFGMSFFGDYSSYLSYYQDVVDGFVQAGSMNADSEGVMILKNPEFSRVILSIDKLFPKAKLIATIRDPRDQVAAEFEVGRKRLAMGIPDRNFSTRNVVALANNYNNYNKEILELYKREPNRIHIVRYEDLVKNTAEVLNKLESVTNLNLSFDHTKDWPRVTEFAGLDIVSPSSSILYGKPISAQSVERYKQDLSKDEISKIENVCQKIISEFNY